MGSVCVSNVNRTILIQYPVVSLIRGAERVSLNIIGIDVESLLYFDIKLS